MAHVGIVSAAYYGDVMPYVPVAEELARRGHDVTMVVPDGFHEVLRGGPYALVHLGTAFSPRELAEHGDVLDRADSPRGMRDAAALWVKQLSVDPAEQVLAVLGRLDVDLWFVHPSLFWLVEIAAADAGTSIVVGHLFPMMLPSADQAPPSLPREGGRTLNRLGWRLGRAMAGRMMYDREINALRRTRGLPAASGHVAFGWERATATLVLTSPRYWPRPDDWDDRIVLTGFTVWDGGRRRLPEGLRGHLDGGPPPVLVTFGTSAATNAEDAFRQAAEAVEALGHRPLLLVGTDRNRRALRERADVWTFAPLPAVLPRCRAVVHAGGHGTTAAALHAGIPQVAMPRAFDQVAHADRITALAVGSALPFRRRSRQRIATALSEALDEPHRRRAQQVAEELRTEDGPSSAADHLEALAAPAA